MELEILTKRENMLLDRIEIQFKISHKNEKTPARDEVREKIAAEINVGKENVIIDFMKSQYGKEETIGYAKVYKTVESAKNSEPEHILGRNKLIELKKKEAKPEAAKKPEPTAEKEKEKKEEAAKRKEGEGKEKPKEAKAEKAEPEKKEEAGKRKEGEGKEKPKEAKESKAEPEKKEETAKRREGEGKEKPKQAKEEKGEPEKK